jgi:hypothetical protein
MAMARQVEGDIRRHADESLAMKRERDRVSFTLLVA